MARKWSNINLPGALHFVTGNCINRLPVFTETACCQAFLAELKTLNEKWPAKLIAYVLMKAEKLSKAMKEMGWHYIGRDEDK